MKIDTNVLTLVKAINAIPGISTFSSCGGHDNPRPNQAPAGTFTVSIDADRNSAGWRGLTVLSRAVADYGHVDLIAWFNGDDDTPADEVECLCFELRGTTPAVADELADVISTTLAGILPDRCRYSSFNRIWAVEPIAKTAS